MSSDILGSFLHTGIHTAKEVTIALGMIVLFFVVCQILFLHLSSRSLHRIVVGVVLRM